METLASMGEVMVRRVFSVPWAFISASLSPRRWWKRTFMKGSIRALGFSLQMGDAGEGGEKNGGADRGAESRSLERQDLSGPRCPGKGRGPGGRGQDPGDAAGGAVPAPAVRRPPPAAGNPVTPA